MSPHIRESKTVLDSGFQVLDSSFCQWAWILDSNPGRYVARKISSAFSRSDTRAQQSPKALDQTNSVPGKSQKYAPVTTDIDGSLVSSTEQKQMGFSYGVISHANGEEGTARQRVT
ncbi:unnamed protein product [Porites evermanni]|uniref:Uncharacterized protein n=1 Tax=Porites evermanni TaxID=104178 RepID=A0ABN8SHL4_9CNID|nr:unnamed protein product [Porites evermanni]